MEIQHKVLDILEDITGSSEVRENMEVDLFEEGLLDSLGSVQLLIDLEGECNINVPVSEFDRNEWQTPKKIIDRVVALQG